MPYPYRDLSKESVIRMHREVEHKGHTVRIDIMLRMKQTIPTYGIDPDACPIPVFTCSVHGTVDGDSIMPAQFCLPTKVMTTAADVEIECKRYVERGGLDFDDIIYDLKHFGYQ